MIQCDIKPRVNDIVGVKLLQKTNSIKYSQFRNNFTTGTFPPIWWLKHDVWSIKCEYIYRSMFNLEILANLPTLLFFLQDFYLFKMLKVARSLFKSEKCFQLYEVSGFREAVELLTPWLYQFGLNKSIQSKIDKTENLNCCNRSSQIDGHWSRWEFITFKSWTQHGIEILC